MQCGGDAGDGFRHLPAAFFSKTIHYILFLLLWFRVKLLSPSPHRVPIFEGRRKTVKCQSYSYMIVCINTSCARLYPLGCVWTPLNYIRVRARSLPPVVAKRKWLLFNGCRLKHQSALYWCSVLEWDFQFVCECCSRQVSSVLGTSASCWWTNTGCCLE